MPLYGNDTKQLSYAARIEISRPPSVIDLLDIAEKRNYEAFERLLSSAPEVSYARLLAARSPREVDEIVNRAFEDKVREALEPLERISRPHKAFFEIALKALEIDKRYALLASGKEVWPSECAASRRLSCLVSEFLADLALASKGVEGASRPAAVFATVALYKYARYLRNLSLISKGEGDVDLLELVKGSDLLFAADPITLWKGISGILTDMGSHYFDKVDGYIREARRVLELAHSLVFYESLADVLTYYLVSEYYKSLLVRYLSSVVVLHVEEY